MSAEYVSGGSLPDIAIRTAWVLDHAHSHGPVRIWALDGKPAPR